MEQISLFSLLPELKKNSPALSNSFVYRDLCIYLTRKPYQKAIQLSVELKGKVQVSCSHCTFLAKVIFFLADHWQWIQKQLEEQKKIRKKYPLKKFKVGESFLFQGRKLQLRYENVFSMEKHCYINGSVTGFHVGKSSLIYYWRESEDLSSDNLKKELKVFYETAGKKKLQESLLVCSSRMQLVPKSVRIGSQRSLWGSCSSKGNISLNWRLVAAPPAVLNYVVVHELAHLKHLNHSLSFWSFVSQFCPKYKAHENWLQHNTYALDFLLPRSQLHG